MIAQHILAAVFCYAVGVPVLIAAQSIRIFGYDVMGGRAFPSALAVLLLVFGSVRLATGLIAIRHARARGAPLTLAAIPFASVPAPALKVFCTTLVYMALVSFGIGDFIVISGLYMLASGLLARSGVRSAIETVLLTALVIAALLAMETVLGLRMIGR